eukprot:gene26588-35257_t
MCDHVFHKVSKNSSDYLRIQQIIENAVREQPWDDRLSPEDSLAATVEAMRKLGYRLITPSEYMSKSKLSSNIPLWIMNRPVEVVLTSPCDDTMNIGESIFSMDNDFPGADEDEVDLRVHSLKESPASISTTTVTLINTQLATEEWPRADLLKH